MIRSHSSSRCFSLAQPVCPLQQQDSNKKTNNKTSKATKRASHKASSRTSNSPDQSRAGFRRPACTSESSSKKPRADNDKGGKDATPDAPPAISSDAEKAKAAAIYNPLPAQQDIEVGMYYLHKGDVDAAIDRFLDAIQQRPNFAKAAFAAGERPTRKSTTTNRP